jgi:hypothetical protein
MSCYSSGDFILEGSLKDTTENLLQFAWQSFSMIGDAIVKRPRARSALSTAPKRARSAIEG